MIPVLPIALLLLAGATAAPDAILQFSAGGGLAYSGFDVDSGSGDGNLGLYGTLGTRFPGGLLLRASLSFTEFSVRTERVGIDENFLRLDLSAGYTFRRQRSFRPFVHGGLVLLSVNSPGAKAPLVYAESGGLTFGGGFEFIERRHGVFVDVNFDPAQSFDFDDPADGNIDLHHWELHVGYLYRFDAKGRPPVGDG